MTTKNEKISYEPDKSHQSRIAENLAELLNDYNSLEFYRAVTEQIDVFTLNMIHTVLSKLTREYVIKKKFKARLFKEIIKAHIESFDINLGETEK